MGYGTWVQSLKSIFLYNAGAGAVGSFGALETLKTSPGKTEQHHLLNYPYFKQQVALQ